MALPEHLKHNFETLQRAFEGGDAALMECRRASDGKVVALVCAVERDGEEFTMVPFAEMVDGDPYELYEPPNPEGGFHPVESEKRDEEQANT